MDLGRISSRRLHTVDLRMDGAAGSGIRGRIAPSDKADLRRVRFGIGVEVRQRQDDEVSAGLGGCARRNRGVEVQRAVDRAGGPAPVITPPEPEVVVAKSVVVRRKTAAPLASSFSSDSR